jgi:hypothetical protein
MAKQKKNNHSVTPPVSREAIAAVMVRPAPRSACDRIGRVGLICLNGWENLVVYNKDNSPSQCWHNCNLQN